MTFHEMLWTCFWVLVTIKAAAIGFAIFFGYKHQQNGVKTPHPD